MKVRSTKYTTWRIRHNSCRLTGKKVIRCKDNAEEVHRGKRRLPVSVNFLVGVLETIRCPSCSGFSCKDVPPCVRPLGWDEPLRQALAGLPTQLDRDGY